MGGLASRRLCRTSWGLLPPLRDTKCLAFVLWLAMNGCCVLDVHLNVVFQSILAKRGAPVVRSAFRKHSRSNALTLANLFREPCRNTLGKQSRRQPHNPHPKHCARGAACATRHYRSPCVGPLGAGKHELCAAAVPHCQKCAIFGRDCVILRAWQL